MFTVDFTATSDNLSRYFFSSNDSNGLHVGCKLIRGMGMQGNMVRKNGVCAGLGSARWDLECRLRDYVAPCPAVFSFSLDSGALTGKIALTFVPNALESIVNSPRDWRTRSFIPLIPRPTAWA